MMKDFRAILIYTVIMGLLYAGEIMGIEYAYNLSVFVVWLIVVLGVFALFADAEKVVGNKAPIMLVVIFRYALVVFLITIGWTWAGAVLLIVTAVNQVKAQEYRASKKTEVEG